MSIALCARLSIASARKTPAVPLAHAARLLLRLPAETRTSIYRSHVAQFHASPRQSDATIASASASAAPELATASEVTNPPMLENTIWALLENFHSASGLPWSFTIPLSALLVRMLLLPWALEDRAGQQRYLDLQPLLNAWRVKLRDYVNYRFAYSQDSDWLRRKHLQLMTEKRSEIISRWGATGWCRGSQILVQLPVFVGMSSVYRRMSGAPDSIFSGYLSALPIIGNRHSSNTAYLDGEAVGYMTDPAMMYEGMLWFPNLMLVDTTYGLGIATSAMNLAIIAMTAIKARKGAGSDVKPSMWQRTLRNAGVLISLLIIPVSAHMPSGVMLYWTSSTACTMASNMLLEKFRPLRIAPRPCRKKAKVSFEFLKQT